ncbi:MAG TPA: serine hydrolase domain-containing protein [Steroidobacteraceae bacterium]|nr:serine hydrolase domain-containing protein [Steroidobacteraceae bacterium]
MNRRTTFPRTAVAATLLALGPLALAPTRAALADTAGSAGAVSAERHASRAAAAELSDVLTAAVERGDTPAVVGLIVDRHGVLYEGAAGTLNGSGALPANAIFNIASMTKPVTSVAIMMLAEQGKLSIEDPVSKYLPGFDHLQVITKFNPKDGTYETRPAKHVMTVHHLLTHTSGIGYGFTNPIVARLQQGTQKQEWELPLLSEPGEQWHYSASTRVLGLILEKVTGQDLESWYQEHIFRPLGMTDTSYAVPKDKQARLITPLAHKDGKFEARAGGPVPATPTPPYRGDGGLYSTASDYGIFIRMLLNGGRLGNTRILSAKSVREMGRNQIGSVLVTLQPDAMPDLTRPFPLGAGHDKFGLGFQVTADTPDAQTYRRPGSLSWAGIFNTEFWIDPRTGLGGVLMMQFLPFYDEGAIRTLREFEASTYRQFAR